MKTQQALELLGVSRTTLSNYVKNGTIKAKDLKNGRYDYDDASIYKFLRSKRHTAIYTSVSEDSDQEELNVRIKRIRAYVRKKYGQVKIGVEYKDTATSALLGKRPELLKLMKEVVTYKIDRVVVYDKMDLDPLGFPFFRSLLEPLGVALEAVFKKEYERKGASSLLTLMNSHYFDMEMSEYLRTKVRGVIMNAAKPTNSLDRWDELTKELSDLIEFNLPEFENDKVAHKELQGMLRELKTRVVSKLETQIRNSKPKPETKRPNKVYNPKNRPRAIKKTKKDE